MTEGPVLGFVLYAAKFNVIYRGHIYFDRITAEDALARIVWHNREHYRIHEVRLGEAR